MADREATYTAPVNIAVVKYWGKRDVALNLPCNGSIRYIAARAAAWSTPARTNTSLPPV
jgi:diphosphomevalonate decarboxylase